MDFLIILEVCRRRGGTKRNPEITVTVVTVPILLSEPMLGFGFLEQ